MENDEIEKLFEHYCKKFKLNTEEGLKSIIEDIIFYEAEYSKILTSKFKFKLIKEFSTKVSNIIIYLDMEGVEIIYNFKHFINTLLKDKNTRDKFIKDIYD